MIELPSPHPSRPAPVLAFAVLAVQTVDADCDNSVGAQLKSPPDSQLPNKQSPQARYECKHTRKRSREKRSRLSTSCSSKKQMT